MTRFPFAAFAERLPHESSREAFAAFAGSMRADVVLARIRDQQGLERPRAAPPCNWARL
jgi:hypothetical protein